jgi:hypothetical protein
MIRVSKKWLIITEDLDEEACVPGYCDLRGQGRAWRTEPLPAFDLPMPAQYSSLSPAVIAYIGTPGDFPPVSCA